MEFKLSPEAIKQAREVIAAATPGPWFQGSWSGQCFMKHKHGKGFCEYQYKKNTDSEYAQCYVSSEVTPNLVIVGSTDWGPMLNKETARFIAAARTSWPEALDHIEMLHENIPACWHEMWALADALNRFLNYGHDRSELLAAQENLMEAIKIPGKWIDRVGKLEEENTKLCAVADAARIAVQYIIKDTGEGLKIDSVAMFKVLEALKALDEK